MRIPLRHLFRCPAAELLQDPCRRARLHLLGRPGVMQFVEGDPGEAYGFCFAAPHPGRHLLDRRAAPVDEHVTAHFRRPLWIALSRQEDWRAPYRRRLVGSCCVLNPTLRVVNASVRLGEALAVASFENCLPGLADLQKIA